MAVTFPILSQRFKWALPGDIQCSRLASFEGMRKCKWLGVNVNEAMIRNLSSTVKNIAGSGDFPGRQVTKTAPNAQGLGSIPG